MSFLFFSFIIYLFIYLTFCDSGFSHFIIFVSSSLSKSKYVRLRFSCTELNGKKIKQFWIYSNYSKKLQSTLVISKSKGPSKTLRDIRTSTDQICSSVEKTIRTTKFHNWLCNLTPLFRNIYWKYCGKGEKLLPRSKFSSFLQYFVTRF